MNILALKGKRVGSGLKQKDVAKELGITLKTFCLRENSNTCRFTPAQISILSRLYNLSLNEVNAIFFNSELPIGNISS